MSCHSWIPHNGLVFIVCCIPVTKLLIPVIKPFGKGGWRDEDWSLVLFPPLLPSHLTPYSACNGLSFHIINPRVRCMYLLLMTTQIYHVQAVNLATICVMWWLRLCLLGSDEDDRSTVFASFQTKPQINHRIAQECNKLPSENRSGQGS